MGHTLTLTGELAEIRWGYMTCATLRQWTIKQADDAWMVTGTVTDVNVMRLSQQPLRCAIPRTGWTWPVLSLQRTGTELTAKLGPREG